MSRSAEGMIRTVLGDMPADRLGRCDYHEHLFQVSPLLPGDELDDEFASRSEAATLRAAGVAAMVEATPTGLGRRPAAVARISVLTRLAVVHVTGGHRHEHYPDGHWLREASEADLADRFTADINDGLPEHDTRDRGAHAHAPHGERVRAGSRTPTATSTPGCTSSSPGPAPTSATTAWPGTGRPRTRRSWTAWRA